MVKYSRRDWLRAATAVLLLPVVDCLPFRRARSLEFTVYKDPDCTCCDPWVAHLRDYGIRAQVHIDGTYADLQNRKDRLGLPTPLRSCHTGVLFVRARTAVTHRYLIEGHVPAQALERMLRELPDLRGLAVPGMPGGTPGMEFGGGVQAPNQYDVLAFREDGQSEVFGSYPTLFVKSQ